MPAASRCATAASWRATPMVLVAGGVAAAVAAWIDHGSPEELLNASIFFDFRPLYGDASLAVDLRAWLASRKNPRFLHQMAGNALRNRPPLGVVRDFVRRTGAPANAGPQAERHDAVRRCGAHFRTGGRRPQTNTAKRLRAAAHALHIPDAELADWNRAFHFLQLLRLRHQHGQQRTRPRSRTTASTRSP